MTPRKCNFFFASLASTKAVSPRARCCWAGADPRTFCFLFSLCLSAPRGRHSRVRGTAMYDMWLLLLSLILLLLQEVSSVFYVICAMMVRWHVRMADGVGVREMVVLFFFWWWFRVVEDAPGVRACVGFWSVVDVFTYGIVAIAIFDYFKISTKQNQKTTQFANSCRTFLKTFWSNCQFFISINSKA